jgi:hypothetical protein
MTTRLLRFNLLTALFSIILIGAVNTATAQFNTVWQQSVATSDLPAWFGTDLERGMAYGNIGEDTHVFVVSRKSGLFVQYLDPATGALGGSLNTTDVSGGTFALNDVGTTSDGVVMASNMTINVTTSAFKVYAWTNKTDAPVAVINYVGGTDAVRLGDKITVTGSVADGTAKVWAASATSGIGKVYVWSMAGGVWVNEPTAISLSDNATGGSAGVGVLPDGTFYFSSNGSAVKKYGADGTLIGSVPTTVAATGTNVSKFLKSAGSIDYVAVFQYGAGNNNARIIAVNTSDFEASTSYGVTPSFGSASNGNGAGDVDAIANGDGSFTIAALATNNGVGVFTTTDEPLNPAPASSLVMTEYFEYGVGQLLSANGWTAHSGAGTNPLTVVDQTLEYAGYAGSGLGKAVAMTTSEDANRPFDTSVSEGSVYAAMLVNVSAVNTSGDYFFHMSANPQAVFYARLNVKSDANGKLAFGIAGNSSTFATSGFEYDLNKTHLVVVKYRFFADVADSVYLMVNPVGSTEPTSWMAVSAPNADIASLGTMALRQASSNAPTLVIGGIRIGTDYAEVVGDPEAPVVPPAPSNYATTLSGLQENPPVVSNGTGTISAVLTGNSLAVSGTFSGLTGDYTMSHIHTGATGTNGAVVFTLDATLAEGGKSGTYDAANNTFTLDESQVAALAAGTYYVNVHSSAVASGEIRGQLLSDPNAAPTASDLTFPASGAELTISGFAGTAFTPTWTAATDADGQTVTYVWQLMTTSGDILLQSKTTSTSTTFTFAQVDQLLADNGVAAGGTVSLKHRVATTDGSAVTFGDEFPVTLTRGTLFSTVTIAQAYALPINTAGVTIEAVVTRVRGREGRIQDETGGFSLFLGSSGTYFDMVANGDVRQGDRIRITGRRAAFNGLNQLDQISALEVISRDQTLPDPVVLTLADIRDNGPQYESRLVHVKGLTVNPAGDVNWSAGSGSGKTYRITDATVTAEAVVDFRIPNAVNTNLVGETIPDGAFDFVGVLGRFNAVFQLYAVDRADVQFDPPALLGEYHIPQGTAPRGFPSLSAAVTALNARGAEGPVFFLITADIVDTAAVIRIDRSDLTESTPLFILPDGDQPRTVHIRQLHNFATSYVNILGSPLFDDEDDDFTKRASVARKAVSGLTKDNLGTVTALFDEMDSDMGPRNLTFNLASATANNSAILLQGNVTDNIFTGINVSMSAAQGVNIPAFQLNRVDAAGPGQGGLRDVLIANVGVGSADAPAKFKDGFQVFGSSNGTFANEGIMLWFNDLHVGHRGLSTQMVKDNYYIGNRVWIYGISNQSAHIGFNINTPVGEIAILNNQFLKFQTTRSAATDMIGLNLTNALNENGVFIFNNFLAMNHAKTGDGASGTSDRVIGIAHAGASSLASFYVYHNTVNIPTTSQTGAHAAMMVLGGNAATPFEVVNNIFRVTQQGGFGIDWASTGLFTDYNNYLASTLVRRGTASYASITALRASGSDSRSVSREVEFVSNTDLSLTGSSLGDDLLAGTFVFIGSDIFGNFRSPLAPYMGAFEGPALAIPATAFDLLTPENGATVVLTNDAQQNAVITWERSYSTVAWGGNGFSVFDDAFAHGGNGTNAEGRYLGSTINSPATLETPVLQNIGELRFWIATYNNSTVLTVRVEATADGETWDVIETYESVNGGTGDINVDWQQKSITIDEDIATVRFVVGGEAGVNGAVYFDDFEAEDQLDVDVNFTEDFESWTDFRRIIYKWHLETTGGDFSNPRLTLTSDGNGSEPRLTVSHTALEAAIASLGVGAGRAYTGKWTVTAEAGINVVFANEPHNITIQRYVDVGLDETEVPLVFALNQNYPNPFNPSTAITYSVPTTGQVTLNVYTITGQLVATLVDDVKAPGVHTVTFDASRMASGVYIYRLVADGFTQTHKMTLVK